MNRKWKYFLFIILFIILTCSASIYASRNCLTVTRYDIHTEKLKTSLRVVQITDLHGSQFGKNNVELIEKVRAQQPDLIVLTGDLLNSDEQEYSIALDLVENLLGIAPTYASYGNHEDQYEKNFDVNLTTVFEEAGATVLVFSHEDIEVNGEKIRIGGLYGYCIPGHFSEARENESAYLEEFSATDTYTMLLTHMPYC